MDGTPGCMKKYLLTGRETKQRGSKLRLKRRSKRRALVFIEVIVLDRQEWWRKGHRPFGLAVIMALVNIRWPIGPWLHMTNVQVTFSLILLLRLSKWETKKNNRTKEKINTDSPSHLMLHSRGQSIDADFLQPSEQLVQGLSKGGQGLPDIQMSISPIKCSTTQTSRALGNTCSREKHSSIWLQSPGNSPATAGLRLLHQAALDLLSLLLEPGFGCKFHMSYMLFDCICTGCLLLQPSMTWCKVEKGQTSPSRSSTFSVSPSVAVVLGWKEACVYKDTFVCLKILLVINLK